MHEKIISEIQKNWTLRIKKNIFEQIKKRCLNQLRTNLKHRPKNSSSFTKFQSVQQLNFNSIKGVTRKKTKILDFHISFNFWFPLFFHIG